MGCVAYLRHAGALWRGGAAGACVRARVRARVLKDAAEYSHNTHTYIHTYIILNHTTPPINQVYSIQQHTQQTFQHQ